MLDAILFPENASRFALICAWLSAALIFYVYIGFPGLLWAVSQFVCRPVRKGCALPRVSLIIAAWNEEKSIARKLENALKLDYPADKLEIIVASDGSDDATVANARRYATERVIVLDLPRRGKIFALNDAVARSTGEILIFSDANAIFARDALQHLAQNFVDPEVGGVCGNQVYSIEEGLSDSTGHGETLYWNFDKWVKQKESEIGSIVSAHGAIYAIRRRLYWPPASAAVTDDFAISTGVIEQGYRLVFEPRAIAYEAPMPAAEREFNRKVRIMNRGLRGVLMRRRLLNPWRYGFYAVELFSHKVLRRLVPVFLIIAFVACLILSRSSVLYLALAGLQTSFYGLAGIGFLLRRHTLGQTKLFYIPFFYCLANAAALVAVLKLLRGQRIERWQPQRHELA